MDMFIQFVEWKVGKSSVLFMIMHLEVETLDFCIISKNREQKKMPFLETACQNESDFHGSDDQRWSVGTIEIVMVLSLQICTQQGNFGFWLSMAA